MHFNLCCIMLLLSQSLARQKFFPDHNSLSEFHQTHQSPNKAVLCNPENFQLQNSMLEIQEARTIWLEQRNFMNQQSVSSCEFLFAKLNLDLHKIGSIFLPFFSHSIDVHPKIPYKLFMKDYSNSKTISKVLFNNRLDEGRQLTFQVLFLHPYMSQKVSQEREENK